MKHETRHQLYALAMAIMGIVALVLALSVVSYGSELGRQMSREHQDWVITKVKRLNKGQLVHVELKNGTAFFATYRGYVGYDDTLFLNARGGWLNDDGYGTNEVLDIRAVMAAI